MNINRRGFFAAAASSPLAIPEVAKKIEEMSLTSGSSPPPPSAPGPSTNPVGFWQEQLRDLIANPPRVNTRYINRLDADLVANRSLALHVRIREQANRDARRDFEDSKSYYERMLRGISGT